MLKAIKKALSFYVADLVGILFGIVLIYFCSNTELFYVVISPQLYIVTALLVFLFHSWLWLLVFHGESAYTKIVFANIFKDFLRVTLATISMIGIYFLTSSFI